MMKHNERLEELASVIGNVINDAFSSIDRESNVVDSSNKKRCAFCGAFKIDVVIPRGNKDLLVCLPCYTAAKAIQEGDSEKRRSEEE